MSTMATINTTPGVAGSGDDTFTSPDAASRDKWNFNATSLPAGYTYKIHTQVGNGPVTPTVLTIGQNFRPGLATSGVSAFVTYTEEGKTNDVRFTHAVPATTGADVIGWTPGEGQAGAPQPTVTVSIVPGLGGDI
jgi:hypothetical protein